MSVPRRAPVEAGKPAQRVRYEDDLYTWVGQQVALLRAGRAEEIDAENIAEELGDVATSEYNSLRSALTIVLLRLLKWDHQPERRSRSWDNSVEEHRGRVLEVLDDSPGLKPRLPEAIGAAYKGARARASTQTDRPRTAFSPDCPYTLDEIMTRPFVYDPE
jgi:hypothetical protein